METKPTDPKPEADHIEPDVEPASADENALPDSDFDPVEPEMDHKLHASNASWLTWMKGHIGQKETGKHGHKSNPFIVGLFKHTGTRTKSDSTPWCAAAVSASLECTNHKSAHSAAAVSYAKFGKASALVPGAILVFRWPKGGHHVSICSGVGKTTVQATGGNQSDSIKTSVFARKSIVAIRWPLK